MLANEHLTELTKLRHQLHQNPELSGEEVNTATRIVHYLNQFSPSKIISDLGRHGVAAIFESGNDGPTTLIRSELDALPIHETNEELNYKSKIKGVSHKCGHDGHMATVSGLANLLHKSAPKKGKVVLLFQSAEETGQGARWILQDPIFDKIKPDYCFALHNLPGYPKHSIIIKEGTFCAASKGLKIRLEGITSHASEPEKGISPTLVVASLIPKLLGIHKQDEFEDFVLSTLTHTSIGERTFGVSPAIAEIFLTIRAYLDKDLEKLESKIQQSVKDETSHLVISFSEHEAFDATMNHPDEAKLVKSIALENDLELIEMSSPNRWSEDFGLFLQQSKGAMFGLGSGESQPALHNPDYDFPDELIETGVRMFWGILKKFNL